MAKQPTCTKKPAAGISAGNTAADGKDNAPVEQPDVVKQEQDEVAAMLAQADQAGHEAEAAKQAEEARSAGVGRGSGVLFITREKEAEKFDLVIGPDTRIKGAKLASGKVAFRVPEDLVERAQRHHLVKMGRIIIAE